jgi:sensor histidine kinase YesM
VWLIVSVLHFFLIRYYFDFTTAVVIADSFISNLMAAVMGLSLWFSLRYGMGNKDRRLIESLSIHMISAIVLLSVWMGFTYVTLLIIFDGYDTYFEFFKESLIYRFVGGMFLYSILVLFYYLIIYYQNIKEKSENENRLNMLIKEAEIEGLKTQLNPHFLFNSLNSISSLTIQNPDKAQEMVILLSELLRYSVNGTKNKFVQIEEELETLQKYVDIEKVRYGEKLQVDIQVEENCNGFLLPPMILQPLIENAIKYGRGQSGGESFVGVHVQMIDGHCQISVENNYDKEFVNNVGEGIGLKNIQKRLEILYSYDYQFETHDDGKVFKALMILPKTEIDHEE